LPVGAGHARNRDREVANWRIGVTDCNVAGMARPYNKIAPA